MPQPTEIRVRKAARRLEVAFADGSRFSYPAELLRVESPSAEVQGHSPAERVLVSGRRDVGLVAAEPVGNYGVRLVFDDGHDTGIYSWDYLFVLGRDQEQRWHKYLNELAAAGLDRDP